MKTAKGKTERKSVPETWHKAFVSYGTKPDAVKLIVRHMKTELPEKDTNWEKWVDLVRGRFNRGELVKGAKAPAKPLPPYNGKRSK